MADNLRTLRVELEAGIADFQKQFTGAGKSVDELGKKFKRLREAEMDAVHGEALKLNESFSTTGKRAGAFADSIGKTATTLARSADAFGLPVGPLRALDDVMDVVEIGFGNLSKSAAGFNAASIGVAGAGLAIGTAIGTALRNLTPLGKWLDKYADKLSGLTATEAAARAASRAAYARLKDKQAESVAPENINATVEGLLKQKDAADTLAKASELLGFQVKDLATAERVLAIQEANSAQGRAKAAETHKKAAQAARDHAAAVQTLKDGVHELVTQMAEVGSVIPDLPKIPFTEPGTLGSIKDAAQSTHELGMKLAEAAARGGLGMEQVQRKLEGMGIEADDARRIVESLRTVFDQAAASGSKVGIGIGASLKASLKAAVADLPSVILGALQGGGDVGKAVGAHLGGSIGTTLGEQLGPKLSKALGETLGGALASLAGPLGAILGGLAGKLFGKIGGLFGGGEVKKVNDLRDAFFQAQGGFVALQQKLVGLSNQDLVKKIFNARTVEQFNAAVSEVMGLLDTQAEAQQKLKEATDRYGFTLAELGPTMRRQELDAQAAQLLQDFKLLVASGIDVNTVMGKMGPDLAEFVKQSLAAGQAIPMAMKPMIDQLIQSGQLLDANGNAFASAEEAGITFTESLTEGLSRAVTAIEALVAALTGVPAVTIPVNVVGKPSNQTGDGGEVPSFATGGIGNFGSGTLALLHGREAIIPLDRVNPGADSGALLAELRALRSDYAEMPRIMARAVRDAMAFA